MKKLLSILLCVAMLMAVVGCKGNGKTSEDSSDGTGIVPSNGKTISVAALDKGIGTDWLKDLGKRYRAKYGTTISVKSSSTLNESVTQQLTSGEKTSDIYFTFCAPLEWVTWASTGAIVSLNDVVPEEKFRTPITYELGNYNNNKWYLPSFYAPTGIVYNVDYLNELGYNEFPTTFDELLTLCDRVRESNLTSLYTGQKVAPMVWAGNTGDMVYMFRSLWSQLDPEGYKAYWGQTDANGATNEANKALLVNESTETVLARMIDLFKPTSGSNGTYSANSAYGSTGFSNIEAQQSFLEGNALFTVSGAWFENEMKEEIQDYDETKFSFAAFPKIDETKAASAAINLPGEHFFISANGEHNDVEEAKNFLRYVLSEEGLAITHNAVGIPLCYKYDESNLNLNDWGKAVKAVNDAAIGSVNGSGSKLYLSGVLTLNLNNYFPNMALAIVNNNADYTDPTSMLNALYQYQIAAWDESVGKVQ